MNVYIILLVTVLLWCSSQLSVMCMNLTEKRRLRDKVREMFFHAYNKYMTHAFPEDELMPLSCQGRGRHTHPSRGDVDDVLGNFSLTLIDTLDTLALMGELQEFENAVRKAISSVTFDRDIVVSLFETNIRVLGGLLGAHVMAAHFREKGMGMSWYRDEMLNMAVDLGDRLLPAFNTTTGIPVPRVNLLRGISPGSRVDHERETCTSCAGTLVLEFAALSRLSGNPVYESKARKAMQMLWRLRNRGSDLVGTVLNVQSGEWIRKESGVGAGIDSYYEYLMKGYILMGDETYLTRFNKHYESVMKYVSQGPLLVDVHMHKPSSNSRNFMDALLAFWPGLQVLKGDIKNAIETHEMLYQVTQRHNFLPEAFTTDFRVHWAQHPLRPEFIESTYFLHKATRDPHYLDVGATVIDNLEKYARVDCGFASIKDVTTGAKEDQMDSYVLAETFKYLFLLFSETDDLVVDVEKYVFTTEAHVLPLSLSIKHRNYTNNTDQVTLITYNDNNFERSCPNAKYLFNGDLNYAHKLRLPLRHMANPGCASAPDRARRLGARQPRAQRPQEKRRHNGGLFHSLNSVGAQMRRKRNFKSKLKATEFMAGKKEHLEQLQAMGIKLVTMQDGRVQLLHTPSEATSPDHASEGLRFMQEMIELSKSQSSEMQQEPRVVQVLSAPHFGQKVYRAGPAQFGPDLKKSGGVRGLLTPTAPFRACSPLTNTDQLKGRIALFERGDCMFVDKARHIQAAGALAGVVIDHNEGTTSSQSTIFAMSGDGKDKDVQIPLVFLFRKEGIELRDLINEKPDVNVYLAYQELSSDDVMRQLFRDLKESSAAKAKKAAEEKSSKQEPKIPTTQVKDAVEEDVDENNNNDKAERKGDLVLDTLKKYTDIASLKLKQAGKWTPEADTLLNAVQSGAQTLDLKTFLSGHEEKLVEQVYTHLMDLLRGNTNFAEVRQAASDKGLDLRAAVKQLIAIVMKGDKVKLDDKVKAALKDIEPRVKTPHGPDTPLANTQTEKQNGGISEILEHAFNAVTRNQDLSETLLSTILALQSEKQKDVVYFDDLNEPKVASDVRDRLKEEEKVLPPLDDECRPPPDWLVLKSGESFVSDNGVTYSTECPDGEDAVSLLAAIRRAIAERRRQEADGAIVMSDEGGGLDELEKARAAAAAAKAAAEKALHMQTTAADNKEPTPSSQVDGASAAPADQSVLPPTAPKTDQSASNPPHADLRTRLEEDVPVTSQNSAEEAMTVEDIEARLEAEFGTEPRRDDNWCRSPPLWLHVETNGEYVDRRGFHYLTRCPQPAEKQPESSSDKVEGQRHNGDTGDKAVLSDDARRTENERDEL